MPKATVVWARRGFAAATAEGGDAGSEPAMSRAPSEARGSFSRAQSSVRPSITAGMLQMLAGGHGCSDDRSRYRQRPGSAPGSRRRTAADSDVPSRVGSSAADVPDWMSSGPPSSPLGSPVQKEPLLRSPDGKLIKKTGSFRLAPTSKTPAGDVKRDFLLSLPLLAHIQREKLTTLVSQMTSSHEKFGTVLQVEDQPTADIIIIWNGMVNVERKVVDATTCEEVRILSSCMRKTARNKAVPNKSAEDEAPLQHKPSSSLVVGRAGRGTVFGEFACLFSTAATETVRVASVGGLHVIRILAASLLEICDEREVTLMKAKAREVGRRREDMATDISGSMTAAAYHYSTRIEAHVAFPTTEELRSINIKAVEDLWHPLGWRKKLALQEEQERAAADRALSQSQRAANREKQRANMVTRRRPASALGTSRRTKLQVQEKHVVGAENIHDRRLRLTTWEMPEQHHVHLGVSGARGNADAARGFRVELDIDAIKDLDNTYLASFQ